MKPTLLSLLLPLIKAGSTSSGTECSYEVTIVRAENLPDEDADWFWTKNYNDVYVEIYGYGEGGDDKIRTLRTRTIDNDATPEWNDKFGFDDKDPECGGRYDRFLWKLYDDDTIGGSTWWGLADPDFLGETRKVYTYEIAECDKIYGFDLAVSRDDNKCGTLFVEVTKAGCCSAKDESEEAKEDEDDKDKEEEEDEKDKEEEEDKEKEEEEEQKEKEEEEDKDKEEEDDKEKEEEDKEKEEEEYEKEEELKGKGGGGGKSKRLLAQF